MTNKAQNNARKPRAPKSAAPVAAPVAAPAILPDLSQVPATPKLDVRALRLVGVRMAKAETFAIDTLRNIAAEDEDAAKQIVMTGYIAGRLFPDVAEDAYTEGQYAEALALTQQTAHKAKKVKDGTFRRTEEQDQICDAARQRWSRAAKNAGIELSHGNAGNKHGAKARETDKSGSDTPRPEATPAPAAPAAPAAPVGDIADAHALFSRVHEVAGASKVLDAAAKRLCTAEVYGLYIKAHAAWIEFEATLARMPK